VLASEEYVVVQQIGRYLEHSFIAELGLKLSEPCPAFFCNERFETRHRRPDLSEQSSYRLLVFNVEIVLPIAFEDSLNI
jgi:hypothetical protein